MKLETAQRRELEWAANHSQPAYVRPRALALLNWADGRPAVEVARIFRVTRRSLYRWRRRYLAEGVTGLRVRAGRGRKPRADLEQLSDYVRQSPRTFGVHRTRWTLATLANAVPSLRGFSPFGVQKALRRAGFHYKRGQPSLHSPDPQYAQKKGLWTRH